MTSATSVAWQFSSLRHFRVGGRVFAPDASAVDRMQTLRTVASLLACMAWATPSFAQQPAGGDQSQWKQLTIQELLEMDVTTAARRADPIRNAAAPIQVLTRDDLHRAGVRVAFTLDSPDPHNIRKLRQTAGVAVAHGLPWDAGLAGLTRVPAEIFGVADRFGTIERGRLADLVLWSGDPLDVISLPDRVFIAGKLQSDRSRQTDLRDRYLERVRNGMAR